MTDAPLIVRSAQCGVAACSEIPALEKEGILNRLETAIARVTCAAPRPVTKQQQQRRRAKTALPTVVRHSRKWDDSTVLPGTVRESITDGLSTWHYTGPAMA